MLCALQSGRGAYGGKASLTGILSLTDVQKEAKGLRRLLVRLDREAEKLRELFKRAVARLTGGRPMKLEGLAFVDKVSGRPVNYYVDSFGRRWMAEGRWSRFRVLAVRQETNTLAFSGDLKPGLLRSIEEKK